MRIRFFISSTICLITIFFLAGCAETIKFVDRKIVGKSKIFNKDLGMFYWDDENTIQVASVLDPNPGRAAKKQQKKSYSGHPLIRYNAVYDDTEDLLFIYGKFWIDTGDVQKISYYTYDPKTRILLEAARLVDHYEGHCTQLQLDKIKKLFTKENEGAMPPYFGYGNFFGYTVWHVIDDHTAEALQEQIDYAVKCKQEKIERNFATDIVNQGWFDIGTSLFINQDSIVRLDSGSNIKTQMEITGELYRKDPMASVHLYSQEMIKMLVGPVYYGSLTAAISQIKLDQAEQILAARLQKAQAEKERAENARLREFWKIKEEAEKAETPGLFATRKRMSEFKLSVGNDERFAKAKCHYSETSLMSGAAAAGTMQALKELYGMDVNCQTGTGFWFHGPLKTIFDEWQAISQEINLGHIQYVIADNVTRIKVTDGTNYVSLYIDVSDLENCHVVDAKLPDIGEHVFTIISKKSAVQIKRNASIELLNAVYHKDFEQRGVGLIEFAENAILNIQTRQEILDSGYKLKQAGKL